MYILRSCFNKLRVGKECYHEVIVPILFTSLWISGLVFTILDPPLPFWTGVNNCPPLLRGIIYIYFVFIVEIGVTFTDIHYVYRLYNVKKLLFHVILYTILPNFLFTILALVWYYYHQENTWLIPFVFLSAYIKYKEVWMANNGDVLFARQQKKMEKDFILKPQQIS